MDIHAYIADLERKLAAAKLVAADMGNGTSMDGRKAKTGKARKVASPKTKTTKRNGPTTNEVILDTLKGGGEVATSEIQAACVKAGKSKGSVSVALANLKKKKKIANGSKNGFWKLA